MDDGDAAADAEGEGGDLQAGGGLLSFVFVKVHLAADVADHGGIETFGDEVGAGPQGMTPTALAAMLGLTGSNLSFHLKELSHAGLVSVERDGRQLFYRPDLAHMNGLVGYLVDHCCSGQACTPSPRGAATCGTACG